MDDEKLAVAFEAGQLRGCVDALLSLLNNRDIEWIQKEFGLRGLGVMNAVKKTLEEIDKRDAT